MAQSTEVSYSCDLKGCRKQPGKAHDRVSVTLEHVVAENDVPEGVEGVPAVALERFDFCSYDHLIEFMGDFAKGEASDRRAGLIPASEES